METSTDTGTESTAPAGAPPARRDETPAHRIAGEPEEYVWVENLTDASSTFKHSSTGHKYVWEPYGWAGSVIELPARVARDPYLRRHVKRGNLAYLTDEEAQALLPEQEVRDDAGASGVSHIRRALAHGASEDAGSRYVDPNLAEEANQRGTITEEQVWAAHSTAAPGEVATTVPWGEGRSRVQRQGTADKPAPYPPGAEFADATEMDGPLEPAEVLTERGKFD